jgi:hypothetical protein
LYVNPKDGSVFYVGKGKNGRALAHLRAEKKAITKTIQRIRESGKEPRVEILVHGLSNEDDAHKVEAAAIDLIGLSNLANAVRGHGAKYGRMPLEEVVAHYTKRKANIREPAVLIRINKEYRYGMTDAELYDATRSAWRLGERKEKAKYAFAVFEGVVREVYRITQWLPGGTTFNLRYNGEARTRPWRFEFVGVLAEPAIRKRYINRFVGFTQGAQNPISYVNLRGAPRPQKPAGRRR